MSTHNNWRSFAGAVVLLAACAMLVTGPPIGGQPGTEEPCHDPECWQRVAEREAAVLAGPQGLGSSDTKVVWGTYDRMCATHTAMGTALTRLAQEGDPVQFGPRDFAMRMLGEMRYADAVHVLASQVAYWPEIGKGGHLSPTEDMSPTYEYVAAAALVRIGMPSVPAMVKNLGESDNERVRDRSAWVIAKVFMGKKAAARVFLEDAIKEAKDDAQRQRLIEAREFFQDQE